jgi:hydroxyacylglutathione hydrolase
VVGYATYETLAEVLQGSEAEVASIPEVDFADVLGRSAAAAVLDVRRGSEYAAGHVPGAPNVAHTRLAARLGDVPHGEPLYVHCQSGVRAAVASAFLASQGYDVAYVNDGFPHYRELADAAETNAAEPDAVETEQAA